MTIGSFVSTNYTGVEIRVPVQALLLTLQPKKGVATQETEIGEAFTKPLAYGTCVIVAHERGLHQPSLAPVLDAHLLALAGQIPFKQATEVHYDTSTEANYEFEGGLRSAFMRNEILHRFVIYHP